MLGVRGKGGSRKDRVIKNGERVSVRRVIWVGGGGRWEVMEIYRGGKWGGGRVFKVVISFISRI
jgi:hypothetical protein